MERSQSLVAGCDGTLPRFFQMGKKQTHKIGREIDGRQSLQGLAELRCDKGEEQDQGIAVTTLCVACEVTFAYKVLQEETSYPDSQRNGITHALPPRRSVQIAGWLHAVVPVS